MPLQGGKRKNKNDFYRFLLSQNFDGFDSHKINNDLLIPRSILKRNNPGGLIKDKRLQEATKDYLGYQNTRIAKQTDERIGRYDALFGQMIDPTHAAFEPKFKNVIQYNEKRKMLMKSSDPEYDEVQSEDIQEITETDQPLPELNLHQLGIQVEENTYNTVNSVLSPTDQAHTEKTQQSKGSEASENQVKKTKIRVRHTRKDEGVFETGLEVIEHEYELQQDENGNLR